MAIVLDNRVMGRPPVINSAIGTRGQITMGGKDLAAAQDLALVLRAGALPVPLRVAEVRDDRSEPRSGLDRQGHARRRASAIALVVVIMVVYYRFSGLLAVGGLVLYVLYTLAVLAGFDAVLTLPGIAGFVLSIGIAVDANVLIFERIREELDHGKTVRTAIDEGFHHAMPRDHRLERRRRSLTAAVLYQYGTGPVKGFAVTLIAGIVASCSSPHLRRADLLPPVAQPLARRPDAEHLNAAHSSRHELRFHQAAGRVAVGLTDRVPRLGVGLAHHVAHRAR